MVYHYPMDIRHQIIFLGINKKSTNTTAPVNLTNEYALDALDEHGVIMDNLVVHRALQWTLLIMYTWLIFSTTTYKNLAAMVNSSQSGIL